MTRSSGSLSVLGRAGRAGRAALAVLDFHDAVVAGYESDSGEYRKVWRAAREARGMLVEAMRTVLRRSRALATGVGRTRCAVSPVRWLLTGSRRVGWRQVPRARYVRMLQLGVLHPALGLFNRWGLGEARPPAQRGLHTLVAYDITAAPRSR